MGLYQFLLVKCNLSSLTADSQIQSFGDIHLIRTSHDRYKFIFGKEIQEKNLVEVCDPTFHSELDGFKLCKKTLETAKCLRIAMVTKSFSKNVNLDPDFIMASLHNIDLVVLHFDQPRDLTNDVHYVGSPFWGRCEFSPPAIQKISNKMKQSFETITRMYYQLKLELSAIKNSADFAGDVVAKSHMEMYCEELQKSIGESHKGHKRMLDLAGFQHRPAPPPRTVSARKEKESQYMTMAPNASEHYGCSNKRDGIVIDGNRLPECSTHLTSFGTHGSVYDFPRQIPQESVYQTIDSDRDSDPTDEPK